MSVFQEASLDGEGAGVVGEAWPFGYRAASGGKGVGRGASWEMGQPWGTWGPGRGWPMSHHGPSAGPPLPLACLSCLRRIIRKPVNRPAALIKAPL